ncbi:MAG: carbohydrate kinase family protein [Chloroflexi bacterium]|nr:carbohydrate kinase family protein [Chloroflexota bacterium]
MTKPQSTPPPHKAMDPSFIVAGRFAREYLIPPVGHPLLDSPGGDLLYAAGGLAVWDSSVGLLSRVGEDLPHQWLARLQRRGFDTRGIKVLQQNLDLRNFIAYTDFEHRSRNSPVSHFARREMTFPKSLLGYQPDQAVEGLSPSVSDIPREFMDARAIHICPMDFTTQSQLVAAFKGGSATTLSLDPAPEAMSPTRFKDLRILLQGVTLFLPSEEELRALFWGETHDLWEMIEAVSPYGCEVIVVKRGTYGQLVYDVAGHHRWEVPAYPARLADPTGVGSAFCGGCLAGYQKTFHPLEAVLHGSISASLKLEGSGPFYPMDVLPGLTEARLQALREMVREV